MSDQPQASLDAPRVGTGFSKTASDYDRGVAFNIAGGQRLIASLPPGRYERVLDVGCGTGLASLAMIERFHPRHITGVDPAQGMLDLFERKLHEVDRDVEVELKATDVMNMDVEEGSYDAVVSTMAFHWFPDKPAATREMARALRPGGVLGILNSGRHAEHEFREALATVDHRGVPVWDNAFDVVQQDIPELESYVRGAGLEVEDIWMERRIRRTSVDAYIRRMRVVCAHLFDGILSDEEVDDLYAKTEAAMRRVEGPEGFEYTFTKLYTIARKPD